VVLAACEEDKGSAEWPELQHAVFTYYVLQGLDGHADSNKDGKISAEELFSYASPRVVEYMAQQSEYQQPQLYDGIEGEVIIVLREIIPADLRIIFYLCSAADMVVTDPDGLIISKDLNQIPGAIYEEVDIDGDDDLEDKVSIPRRKVGEYLIEVIPEPTALPTDTYSLEVTIDGQTMVLAQDVQIQDIPEEPYIFESKLNRADFDSDGDVDYVDLDSFVLHWLAEDCNYPSWCEGTDLDYSGRVNFVDFALFAQNWLWEKIPADITGDGKVNWDDMEVLVEQWLQPPGVPSADIAPTPADGLVNFLDYAVLAEHWLEGTSP
jgi:hypothetical protein